jgi:predicted dehydrogenase
MPIKIDAHLLYGKWHDIEVEDDVTAYVEYENGATGVFITTTGDACGTNRFEIQMDKAKIVAENNELKLWVFDQAEPEFSQSNTDAWGCPKSELVPVETDGLSEQHVGVLNAFAAAILRGEPMIAGGEEGIKGLTLSNAMHLSSWLGKPVELPFDEELYYNELMKRVATSRRKAKVTPIVAPV